MDKEQIEMIGDNHFSAIRGLNTFYEDLTKQEQSCEVTWLSNNPKFSVLSYFLNSKIKVLRQELSNLQNTSIKIEGKIYMRNEHIFKNIYSELIFTEKYYLN